MQKLFDEVGSLDARCYDEFLLSEDLLMEHAANAMADFIRKHFKKHSKIIIACGSGNNGADGLTCARLLHGDYDVRVLHVKMPKSKMALLQQQRNDALNIATCKEITECDVIVDAIVGTGFSGEFNDHISKIINDINNTKTYKIACDVPSGYKIYADTTITMGALKKEMFLDKHKDFIGNIIVVDLGVSREIYETKTTSYLLDLEDLELPFRNRQNTHKGTFGHLFVACGEKSGAGILSAKSALRFGSGLVSLVGFKDINIPHSLMFSHKVLDTATALACGMGLGDEFDSDELRAFFDNNLPAILDADILSKEIIKDLLKRENIVITPHPKEFVKLLKLLDLADISVQELQDKRFYYAALFAKEYKNVTLLLKGANVIITQNEKLYVNPHGTQTLSKGGSGDVLSGLIGALLAQGWDTLKSAINASLAHSKLALLYDGANFSLTPEDLCNNISKLD